jgi:hypothetical protein
MLLSVDRLMDLFSLCDYAVARRRAASNSVNSGIEEKHHIHAHSLAFFSCHHDTSSLIFDRSLAAAHEAHPEP